MRIQNKANNTGRGQRAGIELFGKYLQSMKVPAHDLFTEPQAWRGVTWGLVEGFARWQLQAGHAIPGVNVGLATVKGYSRLALKAGALTATANVLIRSVQGYSHEESKRVGEEMQGVELPTRKDTKKTAAVSLTTEQQKRYKPV